MAPELRHRCDWRRARATPRRASRRRPAAGDGRRDRPAPRRPLHGGARRGPSRRPRRGRARSPRSKNPRSSMLRRHAARDSATSICARGRRCSAGFAGKEPVRAQRHPHGVSPVPPAPDVRARHRARARAWHRRRHDGVHRRRRRGAAAAALRGARPARDALGHQHRAGAGARSDLAGELHGLPRRCRCSRMRRRGGGPASTSSIRAWIRCASTRSRSSGNLFDVLGVRPQVGAGFPTDGPMFVQNELVAVISDRLWRTRYSADPSIIGRPLTLNGTPYTVVGVMPPKFHYPDDIDVWQRLRWDLTQHSRAAHFMEAVGAALRRDDVRSGAERRRDARAAPARPVSADQQGMGRRGSCRCSTNSSATTGRR